MQLPPKRRQIISLQLKRSDVISAMSLCEVVKSNASGNEDAKAPEDATEDPLEISDELDGNLKIFRVCLVKLILQFSVYGFKVSLNKLENM